LLRLAQPCCLGVTVSHRRRSRCFLSPQLHPHLPLLPCHNFNTKVSVYGAIYKKLASVMTEYENHRTVLEHNSELFKKLTFFYAVNNYATLFYVCTKRHKHDFFIFLSAIFYFFLLVPWISIAQAPSSSASPLCLQPPHNRLLLSRGQPRGASTR